MNNFDISVNRFNEFAEEYANRFSTIENYHHAIDRFIELIDSEKPSILELGCGPGNITRYLKEKLPESQIIAIDLAPKMIEIARQSLTDVDFRVLDVRDINQINQKFDAVMCSFCLPFLSHPDTQQLIANCANLLSEKGVMYISTMEGDASKAGFETTSFSGNSEIYFNYYTRSELEGYISKYFSSQQLICQDYFEPNGSITTDMIFTCVR